ncbi:MAG TPA: cell wall hydrolase, partial [Sphingobium sp.]|nr:cell wall hydrolase [Sphingobium sp.]
MIGLAAIAAVALGVATLWHHDQPRPAMQAKIVEAAPAIPRQYLALVQMTEQAPPAIEGDQAREENHRLGFTADALAPAKPFRALIGAGEDHDRALQCLTQAVYYEA